MKIVYCLISDKSREHYCYRSEISKQWILPSINQCHKLNPESEIIVITNEEYLKDVSFVQHFDIDDYIDIDIKWFKNNYVHLSTNQYDFEKNAIMRYMILKNFCVKHNVNQFLHLEPDVLVYSDVEEDKKYFEKYNVTLLNKMAAGCCFFNNAIEVLSEFVQFIKNSYSVPQIDPRGFNIEEEKTRYKYNMENKIGFGGVSDMNYWSLYNYLHKDVSYEQMDENVNGVFYQTCMMINEDNKKYWKSIFEKTSDAEAEIKELEISDNMCYGTFNGEKVRIKYLHCHGHTKLFIPKYSI